MPDFIFVTSNDHKVMTAKMVCDTYGLSFDRKQLDLLEIQADNGEEIGRHKAEQAFDICHAPLIVSDDSWYIAGLRGFPGPYMKYVNQWFMPEDFLRLTRDLTDRNIVLRQIVVYKDAEHEKVFIAELEGTLLKEARGQAPAFPHFAVTSFDGGKHSLAESDDRGMPAVANHHSAYHQLCEWLRSR